MGGEKFSARRFQKSSVYAEGEEKRNKKTSRLGCLLKGGCGWGRPPRIQLEDKAVERICDDKRIPGI